MSTEFLRPGLVSITLRQLSPRSIIQLCTEMELHGIEWGGDVHVPHGDIQRAREVRHQSADAGLQIAAYGSYYRVGDEHSSLSFSQILETAQELGAPLIRVWAGSQNAEDADQKYFYRVVEESQRMGELANQANIALAYEFHGRTLNNNADASKVLLGAIDHSAWKTLWQPLAAEPQTPTKSLQSVLPKLANLHVYHWRDYRHRFALAEGADEWRKYFSIANNGVTRWALLEFVRDNDPTALREDSATLHRLLHELT